MEKLFQIVSGAEQGNASAQFNLGVMYDNGDGVPQDDKTEMKWFTLAAMTATRSEISARKG